MRAPWGFLFSWVEALFDFGFGFHQFPVISGWVPDEAVI
jgi:hypothetical protein